MNDLPRISARRMDAGVLELDFALAAGCPWLQGHFPGRPILPGVVQVGWAAHFAAELIASPEPPTRLRRVKFRHPVLPEARLTLRLVRRGCEVEFEYLLHAEPMIPASSGRLGFAEVP